MGNKLPKRAKKKEEGGESRRWKEGKRAKEENGTTALMQFSFLPTLFSPPLYLAFKKGGNGRKE